MIGRLAHARWGRPFATLTAVGALIPAAGPLSAQAPTTTGATDPAGVNLGTVSVTASALNPYGSTPESGGFEVPKESFGPFGALPVLTVPFSTNSFPQELIRDTQVRDISELGRNDPSFGNYAFPSASGYANFFIRGFVADAPTNNRIDGLPVTTQSGLVLDGFERVDLYKGLFGLLYGFGNPGGLINYVTKKPLDESLTELRGNYSSDSQFGGAADVSRRFGPSDQFGVRLNVSGFDGHTSTDRQKQSNVNTALSVDWRPVTDTRFWGNVGYARNAYRGVQGAVFLGSFAVPKAPNASTFLGADFAQHIGRTRSLEGGFESQVTSWLSARGTVGNFRAHRNVRYGGGFLTDDAGDFQFSIFPHNRWLLSDTSGELAATATFDRGVVKSATSATLTLNREHTNVYTISDGVDLPEISSIYRPVPLADPHEPIAREPAYISDQNYRNVAILETLDITDYVTLLGGVAFSRVSLTSNDPAHYAQTRTTPSAGVIVKPSKNLSLYGSYIRGLQPGTQADDTVGPAPVTNARAYLRPFVSTQYEAGAKYQVTDGLLATLALFRISRPIAVYLPTDATLLSYTFTDDGRQVNKGVEFNLTGRITSALKLFGGATYIHARVDRSQDGLLDGNRPIGIPNVQANLLAEYALPPVRGLTLIGGVRYKSATEADAANTRLVKGAATIDAGVKYDTRFAGHAVTARVYASNLFDHGYWSGSVFAPIVYLGDPRTVRVEISTRF